MWRAESSPFVSSIARQPTDPVDEAPKESSPTSDRSSMDIGNWGRSIEPMDVSIAERSRPQPRQHAQQSLAARWVSQLSGSHHCADSPGAPRPICRSPIRHLGCWDLLSGARIARLRRNRQRSPRARAMSRPTRACPHVAQPNQGAASPMPLAPH
jgi:hypothetical protein